MLDEWFKSKIAPADAPDDGCYPDQAMALQAYYHKHLNTKETAIAITRPIEMCEDPGDNLFRLWSLLIDALVELPESEIANFIQLLGVIKDLPGPDPSNCESEAAKSKSFHWADFPDFGHMWADEHKEMNWRDALSTKDPAKRVAQRSKHIRAADVEARMVVAKMLPLDWGYECIADALECDHAVLDLEIPAATKWIAIAGDLMYTGAVEGWESWALRSKRDFGKEDPKMSVERWSFWMQRIEEISKQAEIVATEAQKAGREMKARSG